MRPASTFGAPDELPRKVRVLIAEDDTHLRMVVRMVLESGGYDVSEARNGREALESIAIAPAALVIADMSMPVMSGADLARQMRLDPRSSGVPFLMLSGYPAQDDCGASAWLRKPFEAAQLLAIAAALITAAE